MTTESLTHTSVIDKTTAYLNVPSIVDKYRVVNALFSQVPYPAGSGAGADVTVTFDLSPEVIEGNYSVFVNLDQQTFTAVKNKTATSFDVIITPAASGITVGAGYMDVQVVFQK